MTQIPQNEAQVMFTSKGSFRSRRKIVKVSFPGVAVWGSCGVGELQSGGVAVWGSCGVGKLQDHHCFGRVTVALAESQCF